MKNLRIFGLGADQTFAQEVAQIGGMVERIPPKDFRQYVSLKASCLYGRLFRHKEERRPDGEIYTMALENVRGADVFLVASGFGDDLESVDEKLMKILIFIHTLRHASAERITLVCPYLPYMRQDRKTESRAPIATQARAMMLEAVGMDRLLTMDVHNLAAEQNAFRVPLDNLEARKLLADAVTADIKKDYSRREYKVLTPDAGGTARTKLFQHSLSNRLGQQVGIVYADKTRVSTDEVVVKIIGDVHNRNIIVVDDMISTGGTIGEIETAVRQAGGYLYGVVATHGLYVNSAPEKLKNIPRIYTADTIVPFRVEGTDLRKRIKVVSTAKMFGEAIRRIHLEGGSISELLED